MTRSAIENPLNTAPSMRGAVHQSPHAPIARDSTNSESSLIGLIGKACLQQCTEDDTGFCGTRSVASQKASSSACMTRPLKLAAYFCDHSGDACKTQQSAPVSLVAYW
jgi:hypothetical protein